MGRLMMRSFMILLSIFLLRSPCAIGDDQWCIDSGDTSTASNAPTLVDASSQNEDFTVNDQVILYCCFISKQPVQVKWYKDDTLLTTGAKYQLAEKNQVLSIPKGSKFDNGKYRCEGSNKHGRESWNITVDMHPPPCQQAPTVNSSPSNISVKKGKSVTLSCLVKTKNDCVTILQGFYWKNPKGITVFKNTKFQAVPNDGSDNIVRMTLTIKHAKKEDSGIYKCKTRSVRNKVNSKVVLNVE